MAVPIKEVKKALKAKKGIVSDAAKVLGISATALHRRIQRNKSLQLVKWEARESIIDMAEQGLITNLRTKKPWAIKYTLSTLGKSRGYVERVETQELAPAKKQVFVIDDLVIDFSNG